MTDLAAALAFAETLATTGATIAKTAWFGPDEMTQKPDGSALTPADLAIEDSWRAAIQAQYPDHGILGEERDPHEANRPWTWVLDPIDGTRPFAAGLLKYASLIALCHEGTPVLGLIDLPLPGARFAAIKGGGSRFAGQPIRTRPGATLDTARMSLATPDSFGPATAVGWTRLRQRGALRSYDDGSPAYGALARGRLDLVINGDDLDPFDICALAPIVIEAGGCLTDWTGAPVTLSSRGAILATSHQSLHDEALNLLTGTHPTPPPPSHL